MRSIALLGMKVAFVVSREIEIGGIKRE